MQRSPRLLRVLHDACFMLYGTVLRVCLRAAHVPNEKGNAHVRRSPQLTVHT